MERIGVRELRQNASKYLALVRAGETVEVTDRGELVALLVSPRPGALARDRLIAAGRLIPAAAPGGRLRSLEPPSAVVDVPSNQQILDEGRAERW